MAPFFIMLLAFSSTIYGQQCTQDDFTIAYGGQSALFSIFRVNGTCLCPAGFVSTGLSRLSNLTTETLTVGNAASFAGPVQGSTATFSGTVSASSLAGNAASLTNLAGQPEFSSLKALVGALNASVSTTKSCAVGSVITRINPDGSFVCTVLSIISGGLGAFCVQNSDCNAGLMCFDRRCLGAGGYSCSVHAQCATILGGCNAGSCGYSNCAQVRTNVANAKTGFYMLRLTATSTFFHIYCDFSKPGEAWAVVWSNVRGGTGKPSANLNMNNALNLPPTYATPVNQGMAMYSTKDLESFVLYTGLVHWQGLSPSGRFRYDWAPDYGQPLAQSYECAYTYFSAANSYRLVLSGCVQRIGSVAPGLYTYHTSGGGNNFVFSAADSANTCSASFGGTPYWYGGCWDGSFWGGAEITHGGYYNGAYWSSSHAMWGNTAGNGAGNGWFFVS